MGVLKKIVSSILAVLLSATVLLAGVEKKSSNTKEKYTVVKTEKIHPKKMKISSTYIGYLKPIERVIVSADTEGPVEKINFSEGQLVKENQILVHIATERLALKKKIAASKYNSSIASYNEEKTLLYEKFQDKQLQVQILQAESSYQLEQTNYEKELELFQLNISTESRFDAAKNRLTNAKANLDLAKLALDKSNAISDQIKLNSLKNLMEINGYQLELASLDLDQSQVRSPFRGIVSKKKIEKGGFINKGQELLEIMDISKVLAQINIPENKIRFIKIGSMVKVTFDAVPGKTYTGIVKTLGLEAEQKNRTFPAEVQINNPNQVLLPGMMARAKIELNSSDKQIMIPRHVVLNRDDSKVVFVAESDTAKIRHLTLGKTVKGEVQVLSGLKFGDNLIISGQQYLTENEKVNPEPKLKNKLARR